MAVNRPTTNIPGSPVPPRMGPRSGAGRNEDTPFVQAMVAAWTIPELRRRIGFIFIAFAIYVVGLHIPVPYIDHAALAKMFSGGGGGILSLVNVFSGGALKTYTIFAMGIIPYINASIIMQLLTFAIPQWQELSKEGESGRRKIAQYTRFLTAGLAIVQAIGMSVLLRNQHILMSRSPLFLVDVVLILTAGTAFLMWLGEQITDKGIGNGVSLIIFCGIMVRLPAQMSGVYQGIISGTVAAWQVLVLIVAFFVTVIGIIYVTLGQRKVPIQHVRKIVGNKMTQGGTSYLPFRVASAGVIPIIFALSIQLLPLTFAQFVSQTSPMGLFLHRWSEWFSPGKNPITGLIYAAIIVFFTYFYTAVTVNVEDIGDQLRKYGSYVPGIRPGKPTVDYLDKVVTRITLAGALFLALIALLQYWIPDLTNTGGPMGFTLVGGTSLLIVVGVALDTMQAIEAQLLMRNYEGFIR
jgi:preprotein translocase subunit SecY